MKPKRTMIYTLIGTSTALGLWGFGNLLTYGLQKQFMLQPDQLPEDYSYSFPANFEEVFLKAEDGATINALHFRADTDESKGVILYCHGNAGDLSRWGELYAEFLPQGYDLFIYDYRGYGKSKGDLSESAFYQDTELIYTHLRRQYQPDDIIIYGRSLGSAMATYLATNVPCRKLILETPFSSVQDLFHAYYPFLPRIFFFRFKFNNKKYIQEVKAPVIIFQGTNDWIVPYSCAEKLKPFLKEEDRFITIEGGNHNNLARSAKYQRELHNILSTKIPDENKRVQEAQ